MPKSQSWKRVNILERPRPKPVMAAPHVETTSRSRIVVSARPSVQLQRSIFRWPPSRKPPRPPAPPSRNPWIHILLDEATIPPSAWNEALDEIQVRLSGLGTDRPLSRGTRAVRGLEVPVLSTGFGPSVSMWASHEDLDSRALGFELHRELDRDRTMDRALWDSPTWGLVDGQEATSRDQIWALGIALWLETRFERRVVVRGRFSRAAAAEARAWAETTFGVPVRPPLLGDAARLWAHMGRYEARERLWRFDRCFHGAKHEALALVLPLATPEAIERWIEGRLAELHFPVSWAHLGLTFAWIKTGRDMGVLRDRLVTHVPNVDVQATELAWLRALAEKGLFLPPELRKAVALAKERADDLDHSIDPKTVEDLRLFFSSLNHSVYVDPRELPPCWQGHALEIRSLARMLAANIAAQEMKLHALEVPEARGGVRALGSISTSLHPALRRRLQEASAVFEAPIVPAEGEDLVAEVASLAKASNISLLETAWNWIEDVQYRHALPSLIALLLSAVDESTIVALTKTYSVFEKYLPRERGHQHWTETVEKLADSLRGGPSVLRGRTTVRPTF